MEIIATCPSLGRSMAMTMVSVRNEPPGRLSEPINRKLTVSWSSSGATGVSCRFKSSVGNGAGLGSWATAGSSVAVARMTGMFVGVGRMVPVGVGKTGWKGVGVGKSAGWKGVALGLGLGLAVTKVNGRDV